MPRNAFTIACAIAFVAWLATPALATVGGPLLAEVLGWNPKTRDVYFSMTSVGESGNAPYMVRLRLGQEPNLFQPLPWSVDVAEDSTYRARWAQVVKSLRPLRERTETTMPEQRKVVALRPLHTEQDDWPRYRVRVSGFNGAFSGTVEAVTFKDPSLRMIRLYQVPGRDEEIGVFSYLGRPYEFGYEVQVPVLLPSGGVVVRIPSDRP